MICPAYLSRLISSHSPCYTPATLTLCQALELVKLFPHFKVFVLFLLPRLFLIIRA